MGRRANPHDNAKAESFMKTLKAEAVYPVAYETVADVANNLPRFIDEACNGCRLHSALGCLHTQQFEDRNPPAMVKSAAVGKDRQYNAPPPDVLASPGRVGRLHASVGLRERSTENEVGLVPERFSAPRLRFKSYVELNAWLLDMRLSWAKAHAHPERSEQTIWEVFEEERPKLIPGRGGFDGFDALPASVSRICLVRFDNNEYSVSAASRPVDIHAHADRIVVRQDGGVVAEHSRCYGRGETVYDPWPYTQNSLIRTRRSIHACGWT